MSLVDYDSSSDEEDGRNTIGAAQGQKQPVLSSVAQLPPQVPCSIQRSASQSRQKEDFSKQSGPVALKLPDAALLLSSPASASNVAHTSDHSSWVAAAVSESASKKRELSHLPSSNRQKVPKGNLTHTKRVPDTVGGNLIPPQLTGRSNVVTEDISKLFVKRQADSSLGS